MKPVYKQLFFRLFLITSTVVLLSCKPSTASNLSPVSPLSTTTLSSTEIAVRQMLATKAALTIQENQAWLTPRPTVYPPPSKSFKPIPLGTGTQEPPLTVFLPLPDSTPAGSGLLFDRGIIPPFYVHDFMFTNVWYRDAETDTLRTYVYGGFVPGPGGEVTQQGVVVVQVLKMDNHGDIRPVYYQHFPTKTQSGSVRVTGAEGDRLILQSTNGTTFYFDVSSREYVPSLTWVSPIATP